MKVTVRLLSNYRGIESGDEKVQELPDDATVSSLLDEIDRFFPGLGLHPDDLLVSVNKKQASLRQKLHDEDEVLLFPPAIGG